MNPNSPGEFSSPSVSSLSSAELATNRNARAPVDAEYLQLWEYFQSQSLSTERQYFTGQTYPLRILELFVLIGIIAFGLTLIRNFDQAGSLMIFLGASIFSISVGSLTLDANRVRFWNQLLWGIVVPGATVIGDPFVFGTYKAGIPLSLREEIFAGPYFVIGYSMILISFSWFLKPTSFSWINALLAGQLLGGAMLLFFIGLGLFPITLFGMLSLFGLLGFVPFIAAGICFRTSAMHYRWARSQTESRSRSAIVFGFFSVWFFFAILASLGGSGFFGATFGN